MIAIVLGSGLSKFSESFKQIRSESFEDVLDVDFEVLDGHERKFIWCKSAGKTFVIISGRFHFYEGFAFEELIAPFRYAVEELGVNEIIVTSASGGLSDKVTVGEWAHINQVVSIPAVNIEIRNTINSKNKRSRQQTEKVCSQGLAQVTYAYHQGPSLGTLVEYKMLNQLGADLVGMSMYPEYCYLKSLDVDSRFLSIPVCNYFPFINHSEPSFEEVLKVSAAAIPKLVYNFKQYLQSK